MLPASAHTGPPGRPPPRASRGTGTQARHPPAQRDRRSSGAASHLAATFRWPPGAGPPAAPSRHRRSPPGPGAAAAGPWPPPSSWPPSSWPSPKAWRGVGAAAGVRQAPLGRAAPIRPAPPPFPASAAPRTARPGPEHAAPTGPAEGCPPARAAPPAPPAPTRPDPAQPGLLLLLFLLPPHPAAPPGPAYAARPARTGWSALSFCRNRTAATACARPTPPGTPTNRSAKRHRPPGGRAALGRGVRGPRRRPGRSAPPAPEHCVSRRAPRRAAPASTGPRPHPRRTPRPPPAGGGGWRYHRGGGATGVERPPGRHRGGRGSGSGSARGWR